MACTEVNSIVMKNQALLVALWQHNQEIIKLRKQLEEKDEEMKIMKNDAAAKNKEIEKLKKLIEERDEEKRKRDEEKNKRKSQQSQSFVSFFKRNSLGNEPTPVRQMVESSEHKSKFKPFQLQANQSLAEIVSLSAISKFNPQEFEDVIHNQDSNSELYIKELREGLHKPYQSSTRTRRGNLKVEKRPSSELVIVENLSARPHKAVYLSFHENTRPAYYGTWSKKSSCITGRRPFNRDTNILNYEVDSDEEWEEEDGESIASSGSNDSKNGADDFEMDDFLVPHGHLSGDEEAAEDEDESRHVTLFKEEDLIKQRFKKVEKLDPVVLGPYWPNSQKGVFSDALSVLQSFSYVFNIDKEDDISKEKQKTNKLMDTASEKAL